MSKLACNIVIYRPDPDMLAARFRTWHVEALLDQAAALIDRCLADFREFCSLDYAWHQFEAELETREKQLDLDRQCDAECSFDRESLTAPQAQSYRQRQEASAQPAAELSAAPEETGQAGTEAAAGKEPEPAQPSASFARRSLELRAEALRRTKDLSAPGRPLALMERRDLALTRLCRDYEEAVNRALVAEEGLKNFYGRVELASPLPSVAQTLAESITTVAVWIRDAGEWLAAYQEQEQEFTRVVSVRALLNRSAWVQLKQARDSFSMKLQVPAELFRGYDNCRLRGVGASLIGEAGKVPWSMTLRLPDEALYERSGQSVEADQGARTCCLLGRVENRRSARPMEIGGAGTLVNASPIGRSTQGGMWLMELFRPLGATSESFGHVEDVVLELAAVGTPKA